MSKKYPHQRLIFASRHRPRDIRNDLNEILISMLSFLQNYRVVLQNVKTYNRSLDIAKEYPHAMELNVLVIGMPNVGKSTLLNALRNKGIKGRELISTLILQI